MHLYLCSWIMANIYQISFAFYRAFNSFNCMLHAQFVCVLYNTSLTRLLYDYFVYKNSIAAFLKILFKHNLRIMLNQYIFCIFQCETIWREKNDFWIFFQIYNQLQNQMEFSGKFRYSNFLIIFQKIWKKYSEIILFFFFFSNNLCFWFRFYVVAYNETRRENETFIEFFLK